MVLSKVDVYDDEVVNNSQLTWLSKTAFKSDSDWEKYLLRVYRGVFVAIQSQRGWEICDNRDSRNSRRPKRVFGSYLHWLGNLLMYFVPSDAKRY